MTNEEAINVLEDYDINFERHTAEAIAEAHEMAIKALEEQMSERTKESSVSSQQKTGHWLSQSEYCKMNNLIPSGLGCYFWCSECNCGIDYKYFHLVDYKYCPKCGAKMQEVQK